MDNWIERFLARWFPPRLPKPYPEGFEIPDTDGQNKAYDWLHASFNEQGAAGPVKPKPYRDGIERHFAEADRVQGVRRDRRIKYRSDSVKTFD